jgi:hypothetical protein
VQAARPTERRPAPASPLLFLSAGFGRLTAGRRRQVRNWCVPRTGLPSLRSRTWPPYRSADQWERDGWMLHAADPQRQHACARHAERAGCNGCPPGLPRSLRRAVRARGDAGWLPGISPARGRPLPKGGDRPVGRRSLARAPSRLLPAGHGPGAAETRPRHPIAPRRAVPGSYADCY